MGSPAGTADPVLNVGKQAWSVGVSKHMKEELL